LELQLLKAQFFYDKAHAVWVKVINLALASDVASSQGAQALSLGANDITVGGVGFDRAVKIQLSSGDVRFDALSVNGNTLYPE
jgi:hypothetical protein